MENNYRKMKKNSAESGRVLSGIFLEEKCRTGQAVSRPSFEPENSQTKARGITA
jgi:hypothetical protein